MVVSGRKIRLIGIATTLATALSVSPMVLAEAQVGLTSGTAKVALVAYCAPRVWIQSVEQRSQLSPNRAFREASVLVRLSANTGYQLIVRGTGSTSSRIWVRAANGDFQELRAGSGVTIVRGTPTVSEREVRYRIEPTDSSDTTEQSLPVRYEIVISPTL